MKESLERELFTIQNTNQRLFYRQHFVQILNLSPELIALSLTFNQLLSVVLVALSQLSPKIGLQLLCKKNFFFLILLLEKKPVGFALSSNFCHLFFFIFFNLFNSSQPLFLTCLKSLLILLLRSLKKSPLLLKLF